MKFCEVSFILVLVSSKISAKYCIPKATRAFLKSHLEPSRQANKNTILSATAFKDSSTNDEKMDQVSLLDTSWQKSLHKMYNLPDIKYPKYNNPFNLQTILNSNIFGMNQDLAPNLYISNKINELKKQKRMARKLKRLSYEENHPSKREMPLETKYTFFEPFWLKDSQTFPEVQYPMNAMETWTPSYWIPPLFTQKEIPISHTFDPQRKFKRNYLSHKQPLKFKTTSLKEGKNENQTHIEMDVRNFNSPKGDGSVITKSGNISLNPTQIEPKILPVTPKPLPHKDLEQVSICSLHDLNIKADDKQIEKNFFMKSVISTQIADDKSQFRTLENMDKTNIIIPQSTTNIFLDNNIKRLPADFIETESYDNIQVNLNAQVYQDTDIGPWHVKIPIPLPDIDEEMIQRDAIIEKDIKSPTNYIGPVSDCIRGLKLPVNSGDKHSRVLFLPKLQNTPSTTKPTASMHNIREKVLYTTDSDTSPNSESMFNECDDTLSKETLYSEQLSYGKLSSHNFKDTVSKAKTNLLLDISKGSTGNETAFNVNAFSSLPLLSDNVWNSTTCIPLPLDGSLNVTSNIISPAPTTTIDDSNELPYDMSKENNILLARKSLKQLQQEDIIKDFNIKDRIQNIIEIALESYLNKLPDKAEKNVDVKNSALFIKDIQAKTRMNSTIPTRVIKDALKFFLHQYQEKFHESVDKGNLPYLQNETKKVTVDHVLTDGQNTSNANLEKIENLPKNEYQSLSNTVLPKENSPLTLNKNILLLDDKHVVSDIVDENCIHTDNKPANIIESDYVKEITKPVDNINRDKLSVDVIKKAVKLFLNELPSESDNNSTSSSRNKQIKNITQDCYFITIIKDCLKFLMNEHPDMLFDDIDKKSSPLSQDDMTKNTIINDTMYKGVLDKESLVDMYKEQIAGPVKNTHHNKLPIEATKDVVQLFLNKLKSVSTFSTDENQIENIAVDFYLVDIIKDALQLLVNKYQDQYFNYLGKKHSDLFHNETMRRSVNEERLSLLGNKNLEHIGIDITEELIDKELRETSQHTDNNSLTSKYMYLDSQSANGMGSDYVQQNSEPVKCMHRDTLSHDVIKDAVKLFLDKLRGQYVNSYDEGSPSLLIKKNQLKNTAEDFLLVNIIKDSLQLLLNKYPDKFYNIFYKKDYEMIQDDLKVRHNNIMNGSAIAEESQYLMKQLSDISFSKDEIFEFRPVAEYYPLTLENLQADIHSDKQTVIVRKDQLPQTTKAYKNEYNAKLSDAVISDVLQLFLNKISDEPVNNIDKRNAELSEDNMLIYLIRDALQLLVKRFVYKPLNTMYYKNLSIPYNDTGNAMKNNVMMGDIKVLNISESYQTEAESISDTENVPFLPDTKHLQTKYINKDRQSIPIGGSHYNSLPLQNLNTQKMLHHVSENSSDFITADSIKIALHLFLNRILDNKDIDKTDTVVEINESEDKLLIDIIKDALQLFLRKYYINTAINKEFSPKLNETQVVVPKYTVKNYEDVQEDTDTLNTDSVKENFLEKDSLNSAKSRTKLPQLQTMAVEKGSYLNENDENIAVNDRSEKCLPLILKYFSSHNLSADVMRGDPVQLIPDTVIKDVLQLFLKSLKDDNFIDKDPPTLSIYQIESDKEENNLVVHIIKDALKLFLNKLFDKKIGQTLGNKQIKPTPNMDFTKNISLNEEFLKTANTDTYEDEKEETLESMLPDRLSTHVSKNYFVPSTSMSHNRPTSEQIAGPVKNTHHNKLPIEATKDVVQLFLNKLKSVSTFSTDENQIENIAVDFYLVDIIKDALQLLVNKYQDQYFNYLGKKHSDLFHNETMRRSVNEERLSLLGNKNLEHIGIDITEELIDKELRETSQHTDNNSLTSKYMHLDSQSANGMGSDYVQQNSEPVKCMHRDTLSHDVIKDAVKLFLDKLRGQCVNSYDEGSPSLLIKKNQLKNTAEDFLLVNIIKDSLQLLLNKYPDKFYNIFYKKDYEMIQDDLKVRHNNIMNGSAIAEESQYLLKQLSDISFSKDEIFEFRPVAEYYPLTLENLQADIHSDKQTVIVRKDQLPQTTKAYKNEYNAKLSDAVISDVLQLFLNKISDEPVNNIDKRNAELSEDNMLIYLIRDALQLLVKRVVYKPLNTMYYKNLSIPYNDTGNAMKNNVMMGDIKVLNISESYQTEAESISDTENVPFLPDTKHLQTKYINKDRQSIPIGGSHYNSLPLQNLNTQKMLHHVSENSSDFITADSIKIALHLFLNRILDNKDIDKTDTVVEINESEDKLLIDIIKDALQLFLRKYYINTAINKEFSLKLNETQVVVPKYTVKNYEDVQEDTDTLNTDSIKESFLEKDSLNSAKSRTKLPQLQTMAAEKGSYLNENDENIAVNDRSEKCLPLILKYFSSHNLSADVMRGDPVQLIPDTVIKDVLQLFLKSLKDDNFIDKDPPTLSIYQIESDKEENNLVVHIIKDALKLFLNKLFDKKIGQTLGNKQIKPTPNMDFTKNISLNEEFLKTANTDTYEDEKEETLESMLPDRLSTHVSKNYFVPSTSMSHNRPTSENFNIYVINDALKLFLNKLPDTSINSTDFRDLPLSVDLKQRKAMEDNLLLYVIKDALQMLLDKSFVTLNSKSEQPSHNTKNLTKQYIVTENNDEPKLVQDKIVLNSSYSNESEASSVLNKEIPPLGKTLSHEQTVKNDTISLVKNFVTESINNDIKYQNMLPKEPIKTIGTKNGTIPKDQMQYAEPEQKNNDKILSMYKDTNETEFLQSKKKFDTMQLNVLQNTTVQPIIVTNENTSNENINGIPINNDDRTFPSLESSLVDSSANIHNDPEGANIKHDKIVLPNTLSTHLKKGNLSLISDTCSDKSVSAVDKRDLEVPANLTENKEDCNLDDQREIYKIVLHCRVAKVPKEKPREPVN